MRKKAGFIIAVLLGASWMGAWAGDEGEPSAHAGKTWQEQAAENKLAKDDIAALQKNGILVTDNRYRQVFSVYLGGRTPLFITSDSLLNAYHVLYEESVFRLEKAAASKLPEILRFVLANLEDTDKHLSGNPALSSAAKKRAKLVAGIALRLLDDSFRFKNKELDGILDEETKKIARAEAKELPGWLGKPDRTLIALDYSRYKPRGFYTRSEKLKGYFRALSWLQSIPFRIGNDEEFLAILMLGNSITHNRFDDYEKKERYEDFFRAYREFIGRRDDWDLINAAHEAQGDLRIDLSGDDLKDKRKFLERKVARKEGPKINDQVRLPPGDPRVVAEANFRIVSAYRTPSAILFHRTTDIRRFNRAYPNGLEVCIALGSNLARRVLVDPEKETVLKTIDAGRPCFRGDSLLFSYLNALRALVDEPEPDAPDFMRGDAWKTKSCNTVLAGWSQMRHTWALQAKQSVAYGCALMMPAGFVEPEPEFFSRMAGLAGKTRFVLGRAGALGPDYAALAEGLRDYRKALEGVETEKQYDKLFDGMGVNDMMSLELAWAMLREIPFSAGKGTKEYYAEMRAKIDAVLKDLSDGSADDYPAAAKVLKMHHFNMGELWRLLEGLCRRLESIAHKQLRGVDLSESESRFIKMYGATIAAMMFYGGNSYVAPRDDCPRIVDVVYNPQTGGYLHVGIARPRKIYVVYPWKGKGVLCKGSVTPYYEFVEGKRLTDGDWRRKLDSDKRPPIPKWVSGIVKGGKLGGRKAKKEH